MKIGEIAALSAAFCWTINALLLESVGKRTNIHKTNFMRLILGLILISFYTLFTKNMFLPVDASLKTVLFLSLSGLIGFAIGDYFLIRSMVTVGTRIAMLMMATSPIMTAIIDFLVYKEKLTVYNLLGIALTLIGIAMVIIYQKQNDDLDGRKNLFAGIFFGFLGALGQAVGLIFSKIGMGDYDAFQATQIRIMAGILAIIIMQLFSGNIKVIFEKLEKRSDFLKLVGAGILGPFVGVGLSLLALQYTSAGIAATLTTTMPIMVLPISIFFFKEKINMGEIIGTLISILGIAILFLF
ncbi:MAG: DMT family transporter [Tissierellia bacterium]|nr:DMT family transporter [Tissierellia bacterium]